MLTPYTQPGTLPTSITPRSTVDGVTYLEEMRALIDHLNHQTEKINNVLLSVPEQISDLIDEHDADTVARIANLESSLENLTVALNSRMDSVEDLLTAAMYDMQNSSIDVSDPVIAGVISDPDSVARQEIIDLITEVLNTP